MARIISYAQDPAISGTDKIIGSDGTTGATQNYSLRSIGKYFSRYGDVAINRQTAFMFQGVIASPREAGSMSLPGGGSGPIEATTTLIISNKNIAKYDVGQLVNYASTRSIMIFSHESPNVFAEFKVLGVQVWDTDNDFFEVTLEHVYGTGMWMENVGFGFAVFTALQDKHYEHVQSTTSDTWPIAHLMGKKPSVSVVDSANSQVVGEVEYIDSDNLTIRFKYPFKGKAFLN
jgi:hypothetical protein